MATIDNPQTTDPAGDATAITGVDDVTDPNVGTTGTAVDPARQPTNIYQDFPGSSALASITYYPVSNVPEERAVCDIEFHASSGSTRTAQYKNVLRTDFDKIVATAGNGESTGKLFYGPNFESDADPGLQVRWADKYQDFQYLD